MSVLVLPEFENEGEQLLDEADVVSDESVVEARPSDERANVPVSVVTERFLRAIVDKVPLDRIEELHLFSPLRQGTIETGIAVVAARVIVLEEVAALLPLELELGGEAGAPVQPTDADAVPNTEAEETAAILVDERAPDVEDSVEIEGVEVEAEQAEEASEHDVAQDDSPYAEEPVQLKLVPPSEHPEATVVDPGISVAAEPELIASEWHEPRIRHTVYTARYRLIVKGPERGKWEIEVVDEADAPLLAVETVVRGVQRRAGEETATVRYDASQLARVLRMPMPE